MNWVDLVIILVLIFFILEGIGKPFITEMYDLISFSLAFILSLEFYGIVSRVIQASFSLPVAYANIFGFVLLWYLIELILYILSRSAFVKYNKNVHIPGEEYLSAIPSALRGLIFISIVLVLVGTFPIQPQIKQSVNKSVIGSWIIQQTYTIESPLNKIFGNLPLSNIN